jgi:hypothetical protein
LVNRNGLSIHHVADYARFCRVAFIFSECRARMVNRWCAAAKAFSSEVDAGSREENASNKELDPPFRFQSERKRLSCGHLPEFAA